MTSLIDLFDVGLASTSAGRRAGQASQSVMVVAVVVAIVAIYTLVKAARWVHVQINASQTQTNLQTAEQTIQNNEVEIRSLKGGLAIVHKVDAELRARYTEFENAITALRESQEACREMDNLLNMATQSIAIIEGNRVTELPLDKAAQRLLVNLTNTRNSAREGIAVMDGLRVANSVRVQTTAAQLDAVNRDPGATVNDRNQRDDDRFYELGDMLRRLHTAEAGAASAEAAAAEAVAGTAAAAASTPG